MTATAACSWSTCSTWARATSLEPELATSVSQPNSLTYTYHLRHGVKFWDGNPMTSADVVYSLDYQSKPGVPTSVYFANVKSIVADGPDTVVITLKQPDAGWKYSLSYEGVIFEKSFALAHPSDLGNPGVLIEATGPWEINSLDPTQGMELSANPHWWGGKVPIQHITVKYFSTETSEALAMRSGEIDVAFPQDGKAFASVSGAEPHVLLRSRGQLLRHGCQRGAVGRYPRPAGRRLCAQPDRPHRGQRGPGNGYADVADHPARAATRPLGRNRRSTRCSTRYPSTPTTWPRPGRRWRSPPTRTGSAR